MQRDPASEQSELVGAALVPRRWVLAVVIGLFVVYNANLREIGILDPLANTLLPASLLLDGDVDLDEYRPLLDSFPYGRAALIFGTLQERDGRLLSSYPPGAAILSLPFFALPVWAGWLQTWDDFRIVAKLAASAFAALTAGLVMLAIAGVAGPRAALVLTLVYGLATNAFTVASQALWQEGPSLLCLAACLLLLLGLERDPSQRRAALAGVALGAAVWCRTLNVLAVAPLGLFLLVRHRRQLASFALPVALLGALLAGFNLTTYGDLRGGQDAVFQSQWHRWRHLDDTNVFAHSFTAGLAGHLVSPNKGLLVYTPHALFGLVGLVGSCCSRRFPLGRYLLLWLALHLVPISRYAFWWGGSGWGPRYLSEMLLPITLGIAWLWPWLAAHARVGALFAVTVAWGVFVQLVGAFASPCSWHEEPNLIDEHPERLWDWRDPQILRCATAGLRPFEFFQSRDE